MLSQIQTSADNVSEKISDDIWTDATGVIFVWSGLGLQDSRSYVQGSLKDTSGYMKDLRTSERLPDQIVFGLKLG